MDINQMAARELKQIHVTRKKCLERISELPKGTLRMEVRHGKSYYRTRREGKSIFLKADDAQFIDLLKERKRLETKVKIIDSNIRALKNLCENYCPYSTEYIEKILPESYRSNATKEKKIAGKYSSPEEWESASYKQKDWNINYKKPGHVTLKGERVRSKSELIIANMLYTMEIPYHYEEEMIIGGVKIAPDFKIYVRSKNRFVILEHFGRMFDSGYQAEYGSKVGLYISNGYMPGRNLFMTYDDKDGNLDTKQIEEMIELNFM